MASPKNKSTPLEELCDLIRRGKVNPAVVLDAVRDAIASSDALIEWEFHAGTIPVLRDEGGIGEGVVLTQDSLTVGEQLDIIDETGIGWGDFDPRASQKNFAAMMTAVVARRHPEIDGDRQKARAVVEKITTGEFDQAYRVVEKRPPDPS